MYVAETAPLQQLRHDGAHLLQPPAHVRTDLEHLVLDLVVDGTRQTAGAERLDDHLLV